MLKKSTVIGNLSYILIYLMSLFLLSNSANASTTNLSNNAYLITNFYQQNQQQCTSINCKALLKKVKKYAKWGVPSANITIATAYLTGDGLSYNPKLAAQHLKNAQNHGSLRAIWMLSYLYQNGLGVDQNSKKAQQLFSLAIKKKYPPALFQKALKQLQNQATKNKHLPEVEKLLTTAAQLYFKPAQYLLAKLYQQGNFVKINPLAAASLYKRLSFTEHKDSSKQLTNILKTNNHSQAMESSLAKITQNKVIMFNNTVTSASSSDNFEKTLTTKIKELASNVRFNGAPFYWKAKNYKCLSGSFLCDTPTTLSELYSFIPTSL